VFDFNENGGPHKFTPLHYAVVSNNFALISLLLESEEEIDMEIQDLEGRIPIDLCFTISAIYKTLKRALRKQKFLKEEKNIQLFMKTEFENRFQGMPNLKHENVNSLAIKSKSNNDFSM
jgi:hypothetical protein